MKYIVTTSDKKYFHWQLLVQYNNFKKYGYEKDLIWVYSFNEKPSTEILQLAVNLGIRSYGILDTREDMGYAPSIKPYVLSKFFAQHPEYVEEDFFHVDPDMLFTEKFSTAKLLNNDNIYMSDTKSYLDSKYIKSKSEELFIGMCDIVGIDPKLVIKNDKNAGGAQYIMKGLTPEFWYKVYEDSEKLYHYMIETKEKFNPEHPIQAWTAEMWALLWNMWLFKYKTKIIKRMNFSWATDTMDKIKKEGIYHNAGVIKQSDLFNKSKFSDNHPFNENFSYVDKKRGSYYYTNEILDTKNNYSKLIEKI